MPGVLFVSLDPFADLMAGPAVRCRELAVACAADGLDVTIAVPAGAEHVPEPCRAVAFDPTDETSLTDAARDASAVVIPGTALGRFPGLAAGDTPLVVDLYCPFLIENLERDRQAHRPGNDNDDAASHAYMNELRGLNTALTRGDYFLCADPRQRDYWLGALTALHRVSPATYREDPQLRHLIATVPFGCPADPPATGAPVLRGVVDGIPADAEIVLWGGGLSPWFDLETLIRAMAAVREDRPAATLVLLGSQHPNPEVPRSIAVAQAEALAQAQGLLNTGVHLLPWIPYAERGRYLSEAALGVSTHGDHLESHFAFRTRLVDYLWARLPMVISRGDALGTRCAALGAAIGVEPGNVEALADALRKGLGDDTWRDRAQQACVRLARDFAWSAVAEPLRTWLAQPRRAADAAERAAQPIVVPPAGTSVADISDEELQALRAEAERAHDLDARLRSLDRKVRLIMKVPGVARILKKRPKN